jgi:hypothetical protein
MQMWVEAGKVYFVYAGHLLALSLPKETNNLKILTVLIRSKFLLKFMKNYKYIFASLICAILFSRCGPRRRKISRANGFARKAITANFPSNFPPVMTFYADKDGLFRVQQFSIIFFKRDANA